ncbi:Flp family type IVb pilin [Desulfofundulus thermosubterraneus]|uniref:Pilus assembly protein Flp/PilA n=1 Tax=Desulfofundulus thermosubterraneus DSM 16057 TaxID=1121432 RepID=A0A1M6AF23_9FIRM|nr:Flp family type IVb pilin [Desulfofundulus thermosubterraneus]SHI35012.1 pilus assembly protein Flp/PilA [Desulfofundulus thermosubterraneus DSM 16057]
MRNLVTRLVKEESGQGMAEYGLILALVAIAALGILSGGINEIFNKIGGKLNTEGGKVQ